MREERVDSDASTKQGIYGEGVFKVKSEGCKAASRAT